MKETYYFSHDSNARNDEKILCLRADYGMEGYGIFWVLIEMMFENRETRLSHKLTKGIAYSLNIDPQLVINIINSCIEYGLFASDGEYFWSESLRERKREYINKRNKKVEAGLKSARMRKQKTETEEKQNSNDIATEIKWSNDVNGNGIAIDVSTECDKSKESQEIFSSSSDLPSSKSEVSDEGKLFANFFRELLPPTQKVTDGDLKKWADTFDKLVRIDKRPREEIYAVTEWARKDSFWGEQGNFLSACKLRNKNKDGVMYYDVFLQKYLKERSKTDGNKSKPEGRQIERPAWITGKE